MNLSRFIFVLFCLHFIACAGPAAEGQCQVVVLLKADKMVNPDRRGGAMPITVRVFQLKDIVLFKTAGFEDIWARAKATLGEDLVEVHERTLYPGDRISENTLIKEDANYLATMAIFREPVGTSWRTYQKMPPAKTVERCSTVGPGGPYRYEIKGVSITSSIKKPGDKDEEEPQVKPEAPANDDEEAVEASKTKDKAKKRSR